MAGLAWGDADEARWDGKPERIDFYDVKGDVEALLAPLVPSFEAAEPTSRSSWPKPSRTTP
ncbi:Uncharacterised protein [Mycobacterium tuberculosis]|nr:Uncharacterised protein [Mycobacterium tuberculosis]